LGNLDPSSGIKAHPFGSEKTRLVKSKGEWLRDLKYVGRKFEPNSLHPENDREVSYQGGLVVNATRDPKEFIFDKANVYALAIDYDKFKAKEMKKQKELGLVPHVDLEDYTGIPTGSGVFKLTKEDNKALYRHRKD
jgi:hypothetical protein